MGILDGEDILEIILFVLIGTAALVLLYIVPKLILGIDHSIPLWAAFLPAMVFAASVIVYGIFL